MIKTYNIKNYEAGLLFRNGEFKQILAPGKYRFIDLFNKVQVEIVSQRDPWILHDKLDLIVKSGALADKAVVLDLKDHERALVWIENRFSNILPQGLYAYWTGQRNVRTEIVDARQVQFIHDELKMITKSPQAQRLLDICSVNRNCVGVLFIDGRYISTLEPGVYAYWKGASDARITEIDLRESMVDVGGQDIMTADKVTLRINAVVTYKIVDARKAVTQTDDVRQALYRESQLVLRAIVGARELDQFLGEKDQVAKELEENLRRRAAELGLELVSVGIRDVILPGDMKELMNKVTEAKKAAEANLIARREETAAIRSQVNTAKLLADNPVLMRLRELEVLEKIAANNQLNIILGDKAEGDSGLVNKVVKLL